MQRHRPQCWSLNLGWQPLPVWGILWRHSLETSVTAWGIFTPKKPSELTSFLDAASISLLVYTTLTSESASNPTSFNVCASFSKLLPWNTALTLRIFCSTGSSQGNCSRSPAFSCCTVWTSVTSRARTSPRKVMTFSSGMATGGSTITSKIEEKPPASSLPYHHTEISYIGLSLMLTNLLRSESSCVSIAKLF